ncbi:WavE lipopolysaccharide synthesi protein [Marine Group I thaumarchaeote SCGC AAA799-E16]|uniref:WavE lipopolysaccharide synthesi protein n=2 Tax=Marine Group I TaxID=905826 RepID=A0A087S251_9ARCH|nr:WavE lipopolysaccharide synthesi protein [Marine Group I thaumarchaeote SCGC AAA799-E16]KFM19805.1 WavE lipopolysaccharide synthesi protein [Marine Group I thaumarchaeote SCGC RSA3]
MKVGILMQGNIRKWTAPIINEFHSLFPDAEIVLSTWNDENVSDIPCTVIQNKPPVPTHPYKTTKNNQIIGCQNALKEMKSDTILKCRPDAFIHNPDIFKIFWSENSSQKIMYPSIGIGAESREYWITDWAQLSSRETLEEFWNSIPLDDGSQYIPAEQYFTRHYVLDVKKDNDPWKVVHDRYFIRKNYYLDFQMELERFVNVESYQELLNTAYEVDDPIKYPSVNKSLKTTGI